MTDLEGRVIRLELLLRAAQDGLRSLGTRAATLEQQNRQPLSMMWNPGGGGEQIAFWCRNGSAISAATGTWPAITPQTFTADVYKDVGGTLTLVATGATIRWFFKDSGLAGRLIPLNPNGDGSYDALAMSCTAI